MYEVAHQVGLIPIVAMLILGRGLPVSYWTLAFAFAMSWLGDSIARGFGGSWVAVYWWLPAQFALVLLALLPPTKLRLWMLALLAAALASAVVSWPRPDWLLTLVGSAFVLWHARGDCAVPLWIYFGAGTVAYMGMIVTLGTDRFMPAWYAYQACRLVAACSFVGIVLYFRGGRSWRPWSSFRKYCPASSWWSQR